MRNVFPENKVWVNPFIAQNNDFGWATDFPLFLPKSTPNCTGGCQSCLGLCQLYGRFKTGFVLYVHSIKFHIDSVILCGWACSKRRKNSCWSCFWNMLCQGWIDSIKEFRLDMILISERSIYDIKFDRMALKPLGITLFLQSNLAYLTSRDLKCFHCDPPDKAPYQK